MSGDHDFEALSREYPVIAVAKAQVALINEVADFLREMREAAGFTQTQMAGKLGVSQPRIAQIESGKPSDPPSLDQIAVYLFYCGKIPCFNQLVDKIADAVKHEPSFRPELEMAAA